jgi:hypothetical protein
MKYERPEAEIVEFKTLEANAALGWGRSNGEMLTTTSQFTFTEGSMERENFQ